MQTAWPLHVHHIIFRSHGGPDEPWNLITLCQSCHNKAHGLVKGEKIAKWELHALAALMPTNVSVRTFRRYLSNPQYGSFRYEYCLTCQYRAHDGCEIWEHPVDWDFGCNAWRVRVLD